MTPAETAAHEISAAFDRTRLRANVMAPLFVRQEVAMGATRPRVRIPRVEPLVWLVAVSLLVLLLSGCGGRSRSSSSPPPTAPGPVAALQKVSADLDRIEARMHKAEQSIAFRRGLMYGTDPVRSLRGMP